MFLFLKNAFGFVHECIVLRQLMKNMGWRCRHWVGWRHIEIIDLWPECYKMQSKQNECSGTQ